VLLLMLLFGYVIDTQTLREQLVTQSGALLGDEGGKLIEGMLEQSDNSKRGLSAVFGILAAAFGATTVFAQLKDTLDDILRKRAPPSSSIWQTIRARLLSFGIVISLGFLLIVTLLANAMLAAVSDMLTRFFATEAVWVGRLIGSVVTFLGTFVFVYAIYRLLPERKLGKTSLLIGAVASTILFSIGRIAIGYYLGHTDAVAAFGAAGSLAVVLIWVNYSAMAFFLGALIARYAEEGGPQPAAEEPETGEAQAAGADALPNAT
jgi:membrane protein